MIKKLVLIFLLCLCVSGCSQRKESTKIENLLVIVDDEGNENDIAENPTENTIEEDYSEDVQVVYYKPTTTIKIRKKPSKDSFQAGIVTENDYFEIKESVENEGLTWHKLNNEAWIADDGTWIEEYKEIPKKIDYQKIYTELGGYTKVIINWGGQITEKEFPDKDLSSPLSFYKLGDPPCNISYENGRISSISCDNYPQSVSFTYKDGKIETRKKGLESIYSYNNDGSIDYEYFCDVKYHYVYNGNIIFKEHNTYLDEIYKIDKNDNNMFYYLPASEQAPFEIGEFYR